jgi:hypothetical protein
MNLVPAQIVPVPLPAPRVAVTVRPATMDDFAFIDALQGKHTKQVGWMPKAQLEGKLRLGHVIIAEDEQKQPVGFCIGNDQYFKRDDCGIIYQLCVVEGQRRGLIGAALVKAMFERAAWGCKLFCCWCAQDIEANRFWESLGFVPLAYRSGSRSKGKGGKPRVHIFWQKRIRENDTTTPWWFPSETKGGAIREDRLVFPIPPDTHWSEAKPVVLPSTEVPAPSAPAQATAAPAPRRSRARKPLKPLTTEPPKPRGVLRGFSFAPPPTPAPAPKPKPTKPAVKNDPRYVAAARELRDRYLEAVNANPGVLLPQGKYDLARALPSGERPQAVIEVKALPQAA